MSETTDSDRMIETPKQESGASAELAENLKDTQAALRQAEQRLQESERLNRAMLSSLPARITILDRRGRMLASSSAHDEPSAERSAARRYLPDEAIRILYDTGQADEGPAGTAPGEDVRAAAAGIRAVLDGTEREFRMEYPDAGYDGTRWYLMIVTPLPEESGGAVVASLDITDRYRAEEQRHQLETQLFQSQRMESIGTLAGGIAHDFNNILTAIIGNIQLLRRRLGPETRVLEYLRDIDSAAARAATLTRQLLSFSRRQQLERSIINVHDTISNLMNMIRRIIGEDIEISIHSHDEDALISADISQIEQVLVNLAVNARDAMPGGGRLLVETSQISLDEHHQQTHPWIKPGRYVQIAVTDTGCGMDEETRQRAFEPFFTTKGPGEGTGLGLSVAYGIVKQHDGFIHLYSEPDTGSTFRIYLPTASAGRRASLPASDAPLLIGGTETILLAEDEDSLRKLAYDILTGLGYTVLLAENGIEALELYRRHREKIALLLLDIVMPRQGGRATFEAIRATGSNIPVIFMTGYSAEIARSHFITGSGAAVLQKPYTPETLGHRVREMLDGAGVSGTTAFSPTERP